MLRVLLTSLLIACALPCSFAADSELDKLQGKWETKKTSDDGQKITQTLEFKKDKTLFKILDASGSVVMAVTADVKAVKAGPFKTITISNIEAGRDEDSLESVDGSRAYVYLPGYNTLTIVSNIDEERDRPPAIDVYTRVSK
jgi:hypothetical protein